MALEATNRFSFDDRIIFVMYVIVNHNMYVANICSLRNAQ